MCFAGLSPRHLHAAVRVLVAAAGLVRGGAVVTGRGQWSQTSRLPLPDETKHHVNDQPQRCKKPGEKKGVSYVISQSTFHIVPRLFLHGFFPLLPIGLGKEPPTPSWYCGTWATSNTQGIAPGSAGSCAPPSAPRSYRSAAAAAPVGRADPAAAQQPHGLHGLTAPKAQPTVAQRFSLQKFSFFSLQILQPVQLGGRGTPPLGSG